MKKKLVTITSAVALMGMLTSATYANETPKEAAKIELASNNKKQPILESQKQDIEMLQLQISLLENAVAPVSASDAVNQWSKAITNRNGAYQYALFTLDLKEKTKTYFDNNGWVTGTSSPWISSYKIKNEKKINKSTYTYAVELQLETSTGPFGTETANLTVSQADANWFIDKVDVKKTASIWERTPYITQKLFTYRATEYAFSIPVEWDTKYRSAEKNSHLVFSYVPKNKAISERTLFSIEKIKEQTWEDGYEDSLYQKLGVKNGFVYAILPVSENQYADRPDSIEYKEFEKMSLDFQLLKKTFMFIEN
ncbi:hypothetical protein V7122_23590 [Bacillus sp. JJ1532]|uniref:hypothetical protein n=1 Tax=Bacillus sp. JJ1532 TaxID=3122958 RepID=UPI002FFFDD03